MADVVVDASVWASYLLPADPLHRQSRMWLGAWLVQGQGVVGPSLVIVEVAAAIARRSNQPALGHRAALMLQKHSRIRLVDLDEPLAVAVARLATALRIRGADAVYVAVAQTFGLPLITWDQEQMTRAASVVQTRTP